MWCWDDPYVCVTNTCVQFRSDVVSLNIEIQLPCGLIDLIRTHFPGVMFQGNYMFQGMKIWSEIHLSMQSNYYQSMRIKRQRVFCRKISQCSFLTNNDFDVPWMHLLCINSLDLLVLLTMNWHWACECHTKVSSIITHLPVYTVIFVQNSTFDWDIDLEKRLAHKYGTKKSRLFSAKGHIHLTE